MNLELLGRKIADKEFAGAAIDSRLVQENGVFFALKGEQVDGHDFLSEAAHKRAAVAVVSKDYQGEDFGLTLVRVEKVLGALQELAKGIASKRKSKVIGVTGSVGKTTTKEFIATLLQGRFSVEKTPGSYNSQATFPLNILNSQSDGDFFVMEMGMSFAGEIARLVEIAPPDIAFVGRLGLAHVPHFPKGLEGIAEAKAEILSHSKTALAFIHAENFRYPSFQGLKLPVISYAGGAYRMESCQKQWKIFERGEASPLFDFPLAASHLRENFLGAAALARTLGMSWEEIFSRIPLLTTVERRFQRVERDGVIFINDSYNANPTSLRAALENLPEPQGGRRIGVIGESTPLGEYAVAAYQEIGAVALKHVDELLCFGPDCAPAVEVFAAGGKPVRSFSSLELLKEALFLTVSPGDVVLIKGANTKRMWTLLD